MCSSNHEQQFVFQGNYQYYVMIISKNLLGAGIEKYCMSWPQVCLDDLNYIDAGSQNHCPKKSAVEVNNMYLYSKINFLGTNKYKMVDLTRCLGFK